MTPPGSQCGRPLGDSARLRDAAEAVAKVGVGILFDHLPISKGDRARLGHLMAAGERHRRDRKLIGVPVGAAALDALGTRCWSGRVADLFNIVLGCVPVAHPFPAMVDHVV